MQKVQMNSFFSNRQLSTTLYPVLFSVLFVLAAMLVFSAFHGWRSVPLQTTRTISLDSVGDFHAIEILSSSSSHLTMRCALRHYPYCVIPLKGHVQDTKLHLSFGNLENIRHILIYPGVTGQDDLKSRCIVLPVGKAGGWRHEYNVLLPDGNYDSLRISFEGGEHFSTTVLSAVSLHPSNWQDQSVWVYLIILILAIFILLPGMLLFPLIHKNDLHHDSFQVLFMVYSVAFYFTAYLIWFSWYSLNLPHPDLALCLFIFMSLPLLAVLNVSLGRHTALTSSLWAMRYELAGYILLFLGVGFLIVHNVNLPLENTWYTTIAGPKAFNAFHAHDAVFQYVNGVAIANHEPFEKYYGSYRLIYSIEDRGILPGVIYAVLSIMLRNFSQLLADSYLVFTIIGTGFNLLVLFPVLVFVRRYTGMHNPLLFMVAFSLNAFILVNYYLTWFKMAGAAFFLGGLYLLLRSRIHKTNWGMAGLMFGIGANMHAGSALGIPFFFLLAVWQQLKDRRDAWKQCLSAASLLILVFTATNLPWSMVKHFYLQENYILLKEHFLADYSVPGGIGKSAELFFEEIPFSQQLPRRIERLKRSLRWTEVRQLIGSYTKESPKRFYLFWDQHEFNYAAFVLYPLAFLALLGQVLPCKKTERKNNHTVTGVTEFSAATLIAVSMATLAAIILLSYGKHSPDITYHLPIGVLILIYAILIGFLMRGNWFVRIVGLCYFALTALRLLLFL